MDISKLLKNELWMAIESSYTNEDYTTSILNAIAYLRDFIREKSDLELDGVDLINQAFSDKHPKIIVTKMQTKNDKNIQKGLRELLSGIYTHIRNPRSHDKYNDTKENVIAIILFVNYLLLVIDTSKSSFSIDSFIDSVYDKFFVYKEFYAKSLVDEIPKKRLEEVFFKLDDSIADKRIEEVDDGLFGLGWSIEKFDSNKFKKAIIIGLEILKRIDLIQKKHLISSATSDIRSLDIGYKLFFKIYLFLAEWDALHSIIKLRIVNILISDITNSEFSAIRKEILLKGWRYFDEDTKKEIIDAISNNEFLSAYAVDKKGMIQFNEFQDSEKKSYIPPI